VGLDFKGYADGYVAGTNRYADNNSTDYVVRHVPWLGFRRIPVGVTRPFTQFPQTAAGYAKLPADSFVIPSLIHDMHDYQLGSDVENVSQSETAIRHGDSWLKQNLGGYLSWAQKNNSLLILTFDEDSTADWVLPSIGFMNTYGLTSPLYGPSKTISPTGPNRILTAFAGAHVKPGFYSGGAGITNVNVLRTIEAIFDLEPCGGQSALALAAGCTDGPVREIFLPASPKVSVSRHRMRDVSASRIQLEGVASDPTGKLASVQVSVNGGPYEAVSGIGTWTCRVALRSGMNRIRFRAFDRDGTGSPLAAVDIMRESGSQAVAR